MCLLGRKVPGKTHEDRMKNVKEKLNSMSTANYQPLSSSNSIPHVQQHPQDLGREELVHCRRFSAFNLPVSARTEARYLGNYLQDLLQAMFHLFPSHRSLLVDCLSILCSDDQILVRKHAAAGLHEVSFFIFIFTTFFYRFNNKPNIYLLINIHLLNSGCSFTWQKCRYYVSSFVDFSL